MGGGVGGVEGEFEGGFEGGEGHFVDAEGSHEGVGGDAGEGFGVADEEAALGAAQEFVAGEEDDVSASGQAFGDGGFGVEAGWGGRGRGRLSRCRRWRGGRRSWARSARGLMGRIR